ncbi:MAG: spermidine/putrescine ABC transporter substrate-binding protein [Desulfobacterales bacterium]|nr:spermidine/putrescine ABC transporter substrate-binding protein [Desulfobacterales bacterium]
MKQLNLQKSGIIVLIAMSFVLGIIVGPLNAAEPKYKDFPVPQECLDAVKKEGSKLYVYNWAEWWPQELFDNFSKEFGVDVIFDYYSDTEEMVAKFKLNPKSEYDIVLGASPANAMVLRPMGVVTNLNYDWLPNITEYMIEGYTKRTFDPGNKYQIPDSGYSTLWCYNSKYVDDTVPGFNTWKFLFENEKYAGRITMLDNMYSVVGAALKSLGYSWNSDVESELMEAKALLLKQKPRVMAYDSMPRRTWVEEDAWVSETWDGDAWLVHHEDLPELKAVLPEEGTFVAASTDFIPTGAKHPAAAHLFLNYIFRPEVNVFLISTIGYPPTHKHTMEFMSDEMKAWPGFILPEGYMEKCESEEERAITGKGKELRLEIWAELKR